MSNETAPGNGTRTRRCDAGRAGGASHLRMPASIRSLSLAVLAVIATVFAPRQATALIESLPAATQKVRDAVRQLRGRRDSTIDKVQRAVVELEQAAQDAAAPPVAAQGVTRVTIERKHFDIMDYLWSGSLGVVALVQSGTVDGVLLVSGSALGLHVISGKLLTPWRWVRRRTAVDPIMTLLRLAMKKQLRVIDQPTTVAAQRRSFACVVRQGGPPAGRPPARCWPLAASASSRCTARASRVASSAAPAACPRPTAPAS